MLLRSPKDLFSKMLALTVHAHVTTFRDKNGSRAKFLPSAMEYDKYQEMEADFMRTAEVDSVADALEVDIYEPTRLCALDAPPKKFYRRSWTSVVRKLLKCQRVTVDCPLRSNLGIFPPIHEGSGINGFRTSCDVPRGRFSTNGQDEPF